MTSTEAEPIADPIDGDIKGVIHSIRPALPRANLTEEQRANSSTT
jgi:hypothetical protein